MLRSAPIQSTVAIGLASLLTAAPVVAEEAQRQVTGGSGSLMSLVTLGLGLLAVLAVIVGCAWLIRRVNGLSGMNNQAIRVVAVMALGARERIALIEVGGTQILVGITASAIRTLHVFEEPVVSAPNGDRSDFARRLQGLIGKQWKSGRADPDLDLMNPRTSADKPSGKSDESDGKSS
ncbi:MAG: flagellar biosynthetic protein FliO [Marinobacter sp.]|uniref:flagellar biosynthetic protein FliO n=1 Tax=Marinobacter sp. TaxID=50741 RepID=UPI00299D09DC|nr:flagellar biosynthetic protein FliO [Marinobacter sp.]MDX1633478.1 flagellar biosynthetic protein FliO [Marinobacter sp.]